MAVGPRKLLLLPTLLVLQSFEQSTLPTFLVIFLSISCECCAGCASQTTMPQQQSNINVTLQTGAVIVVTVVAAAAIAIYESPEVREFAEQCRRRIAIALHALGDEINPRSHEESEEPRYNRPEDAEGFLQSSASNGVDADEESRRRQRDELMYWNAVRLEKLKKEKKNEEIQQDEKSKTRGSSFDDFLQKDTGAEKGTYVVATGTEALRMQDLRANGSFVHRRKVGLRGLEGDPAFDNPFADVNVSELEQQRAMDTSLMSPEQSELSDIYGASDLGNPVPENPPSEQEQLINVSESSSDTLAFESAHDMFGDFQSHNETTIQRPDSPFSAIEAWAGQNDRSGFYSPLPVTPGTPRSVVSEPMDLTGQITPTGSVSLAGSGEDVWVGYESSADDVMSEAEDGIHTPSSWSEVGSVVSEADADHA